MPKYLIELPHDEGFHSCEYAAKILLESGSHFLTNALLGCKDGVHKAWIIVDVDSRDEARNLLHRSFRPLATVIELTQFSLDQLEKLAGYHSREETGDKDPGHRTNAPDTSRREEPVTETDHSAR